MDFDTPMTDAQDEDVIQRFECLKLDPGPSADLYARFDTLMNWAAGYFQQKHPYLRLHPSSQSACAFFANDFVRYFKKYMSRKGYELDDATCMKLKIRARRRLGDLRWPWVSAPFTTSPMFFPLTRMKLTSSIPVEVLKNERRHQNPSPQSKKKKNLPFSNLPPRDRRKFVACGAGLDIRRHPWTRWFLLILQSVLLLAFEALHADSYRKLSISFACIDTLFLTFTLALTHKSFLICDWGTESLASR